MTLRVDNLGCSATAGRKGLHVARFIYFEYDMLITAVLFGAAGRQERRTTPCEDLQSVSTGQGRTARQAAQLAPQGAPSMVESDLQPLDAPKRKMCRHRGGLTQSIHPAQNGAWPRTLGDWDPEMGSQGWHQIINLGRHVPQCALAQHTAGRCDAGCTPGGRRAAQLLPTRGWLWPTLFIDTTNLPFDLSASAERRSLAARAPDLALTRPQAGERHRAAVQASLAVSAVLLNAMLVTLLRCGGCCGCGP